MKSGLMITAGCLLVVFVAVYGYMYMPRSSGVASPEELAKQALNAPTVEEQEKAAIELARLADPNARKQLRLVLSQSSKPQVRAACIQGVGRMHDYECMDLLLDALEDESLVVRGRAGVAVAVMIGRDYHFRANGAPEQRAKTIKQIRQCWKELDGTPGLEMFKQELGKNAERNGS